MPKLAPEMRVIFSAEIEDYVSLLTEGFLALEKDPGEPGWPDRLFRAAHSLKGTSRVMGCDDLARAGHGLEDLLDRLRLGSLVLGPVHFDALSQGMDGFRRLLHLTLDGAETAGPADELLATLAACQQASPPASSPAAMPEPVPAPDAPREPVPVALPPGERSRPTRGGGTRGRTAHSSGSGLEVLKVPVARLDDLINQVGELLVTHQRIRGYAEACALLGDQLEEGTRRSGAQAPDRAWIAPAAQGVQRLALALFEEEGRMERLFESLEAAVHRTRMVSLGLLFDQMPKWVRDASSAMGKWVDLDTEGGDLELDKRLVEELRDPLLHMVRNAVDHGIEAPERRRELGKPERGLIRVSAFRERNGIQFRLEDDGAGLDPDTIRRKAVAKGLVDPAQAQVMDVEALCSLLFLPGFSTRDAVTEYSGRGVGLDVVANRVAALKGEFHISGKAGGGCRVTLWVPQSLNSTRILHVEDGGLGFGLPSASVRACLNRDSETLVNLEGRPALLFEGAPILLTGLSRLLGRGQASERPGATQIVVLDLAGERLALEVDLLHGELEVLQKPLPRRLVGTEGFSGLSVLGDGRIVLLVDPIQLQLRSHRAWRSAAAPARTEAKTLRARSILLVDDSLTTRVQLRRILETAGYEVQPAVDGLDAWARLGAQSFDAVVSDVQMPGLDGVGLTARIRHTPALEHLPIVLVTTLSGEDDQQAGLEAGANAYITKGSFDQEHLLESLRRLMDGGEAP